MVIFAIFTVLIIVLSNCVIVCVSFFSTIIFSRIYGFSVKISLQNQQERRKNSVTGITYNTNLDYFYRII